MGTFFRRGSPARLDFLRPVGKCVCLGYRLKTYSLFPRLGWRSAEGGFVVFVLAPGLRHRRSTGLSNLFNLALTVSRCIKELSPWE